MASTDGTPASVSEYISTFPPEVQAVLERIRDTARRNAPDAEETISYRMPTLRFHGILIHYAAFKNHIGLYPPISGDASLMRAVAPYSGPKGNLKFPLDQDIPHELVARIVRHRVQQNLDKVAARTAARRSRSSSEVSEPRRSDSPGTKRRPRDPKS